MLTFIFSNEKSLLPNRPLKKGTIFSMDLSLVKVIESMMTKEEIKDSDETVVNYLVSKLHRMLHPNADKAESSKLLLLYEGNIWSALLRFQKEGIKKFMHSSSNMSYFQKQTKRFSNYKKGDTNLFENSSKSIIEEVAMEKKTQSHPPTDQLKPNNRSNSIKRCLTTKVEEENVNLVTKENDSSNGHQRMLSFIKNKLFEDMKQDSDSVGKSSFKRDKNENTVLSEINDTDRYSESQIIFSQFSRCQTKVDELGKGKDSGVSLFTLIRIILI